MIGGAIPSHTEESARRGGIAQRAFMHPDLLATAVAQPLTVRSTGVEIVGVEFMVAHQAKRVSCIHHCLDRMQRRAASARKLMAGFRIDQVAEKQRHSPERWDETAAVGLVSHAVHQRGEFVETAVDVADDVVVDALLHAAGRFQKPTVAGITEFPAGRLPKDEGFRGCHQGGYCWEKVARSPIFQA